MSGEEFVLSILAMAMGTALLIVGITKITGLIKSWINRGEGVEDEAFDRLARAFLQHKKDTNQRLQNLEAIISSDDERGMTQKRIEEPKQTIEIEDTDEEAQEKSSSSDSNLRNMLRE